MHPVETVLENSSERRLANPETDMPKYIYVDNSNVYIEGQRVCAVAKGMALDIFDAMRNQTLDYSYRLDFGKLYGFLTENDPSGVGRAMLFGSRPPANDTLWNMARAAGFEVVVEDRNVSNKEKRIDTGIVAAMTRDAYTKVDKQNDTIVLVAGDGDYVPAIRQLVEDGFQVEVAFWNHASRDLKQACLAFVNLDGHLSQLSR